VRVSLATRWPVQEHAQHATAQKHALIFTMLHSILLTTLATATHGSQQCCKHTSMIVCHSLMAPQATLSAALHAKTARTPLCKEHSRVLTKANTQYSCTAALRRNACLCHRPSLIRATLCAVVRLMRAMARSTPQLRAWLLALQTRVSKTVLPTHCQLLPSQLRI
jgi:heme/copper-type cytochrome/quinol oxidase subunit 4